MKAIGPVHHAVDLPTNPVLRARTTCLGGHYCGGVIGNLTQVGGHVKGVAGQPQSRNRAALTHVCRGRPAKPYGRSGGCGYGGPPM
jgi:hypothetical protein